MNKAVEEPILKTIYKRYRIKRYGYLFIGLLLFALAFDLFWIPNDFVFGGVSGLSIIIQKIFNIETSLFIFIASAILLLFSYLLLGKEKTIGSILGSLLLPIFIKVAAYLTKDIATINVTPFVAMLFGSVIAGIGIGLAFKGGFTTGGTDIVNQIISKYFGISIGKAMIIDDGLIVLFGAYVFGFHKLLYSIVGLYLMSYFIDKVLLGISNCKTFYIITEKEEKIANYIIKVLGHPVTIFCSSSGRDGREHQVLFSVIPSNEYFKLKEFITDTDDNAFVLSTDAYQVYGGEYNEKVETN